MMREVRQLMSMAIPMSLTRFIQVFSSFVGMLLLAELGHTVLAASALIASARTTIVVVCVCVLFGVGVVIGRNFAENSHERVGSLVQQGWVWATILTIPTIFLFWYIGPILVAFHQSPLLIPYVVEFGHAVMWGMWPMMLLTTSQQFLFGIRQQKIVLWGSVASLIMLYVFSEILIFGRLGFPALGVAGFGYASALQWWLLCLFYFYLFRRSPKFAVFKLYEWRFFKTWAEFRLIARIGWPIGIQFGGELLGMLFFTLMIGWLGENALAAQQVVSQYSFLLVVPMFGLAEACSIVVSHAHGAKELHRLKSLGYVSIGTCVAVLLIICVVFLVFPDELSRLYIHSSDPTALATIHLLKPLFALTGLALLLSCTRDVVSGALRGLYDTQFSMWLGLGDVWIVVIPLAYWFGLTLHGGLIGMTWANILGSIIGLVLMLRRWHKKTSVFKAIDKV